MAGPTTGAQGGRPGRDVLRTVPWALGLPAVAVGAGAVAEYPYGKWIGIVLGMAVAATAAVLAGSVWNRPGAATFAGFAALFLSLFAGGAYYEIYAKNAGDQVDAVVARVDENEDASVCHVVDEAGKGWQLRAPQNCYGDFEPKQRVVLYQDPLGGLDPWIEPTRDASTDPTASAIAVGLFVVCGGSLLYGGARRRTDAEVEAAKRRRHGPPRAAEPVE